MGRTPAEQSPPGPPSCLAAPNGTLRGKLKGDDNETGKHGFNIQEYHDIIGAHSLVNWIIWSTFNYCVIWFCNILKIKLSVFLPFISVGVFTKDRYSVGGCDVVLVNLTVH